LEKVVAQHIAHSCVQSGCYASSMVAEARAVKIYKHFYIYRELLLSCSASVTKLNAEYKTPLQNGNICLLYLLQAIRR
jgi:hypothetical protein